MARQKPSAAPAPDWTLTTDQVAAVELLASGTPANDIAAALKVSLETLSTWRTQHPGVQAALNARRQELWVSMGDRLRALLPKACEVLEQELEGEYRLQAAVHILKACKLYGTEPAVGPTDIDSMILIEKEQEKQRQERAFFANIATGFS